MQDRIVVFDGSERMKVISPLSMVRPAIGFFVYTSNGACNTVAVTLEDYKDQEIELGVYEYHRS
jgi:hypothetical protein